MRKNASGTRVLMKNERAENCFKGYASTKQYAPGCRFTWKMIMNVHRMYWKTSLDPFMALKKNANYVDSLMMRLQKSDRQMQYRY
jgi:hypothetical protein